MSSTDSKDKSDSELVGFSSAKTHSAKQLERVSTPYEIGMGPLVEVKTKTEQQDFVAVSEIAGDAHKAFTSTSAVVDTAAEKKEATTLANIAEKVEKTAKVAKDSEEEEKIAKTEKVAAEKKVEAAKKKVIDASEKLIGDSSKTNVEALKKAKVEHEKAKEEVAEATVKHDKSSKKKDDATKVAERAVTLLEKKVNTIVSDPTAAPTTKKISEKLSGELVKSKKASSKSFPDGAMFSSMQFHEGKCYGVMSYEENGSKKEVGIRCMVKDKTEGDVCPLPSSDVCAVMSKVEVDELKGVLKDIFK